MTTTENKMSAERLQKFYDFVLDKESHRTALRKQFREGYISQLSDEDLYSLLESICEQDLKLAIRSFDLLTYCFEWGIKDHGDSFAPLISNRLFIARLAQSHSGFWRFEFSGVPLEHWKDLGEEYFAIIRGYAQKHEIPTDDDRMSSHSSRKGEVAREMANLGYKKMIPEMGE